ncbi:MAG: AGE family epimerase/isomerase [Gemmatimonadota bacterium]
MDPAVVLESLAREAREELTRILAYWSDVAVDRERGGFHGYVGPDNTPDPDAPRGAILNARILWAFSAAYRAVGDLAPGAVDRPGLRSLADRAADVVLDRFVDPDHGGVFWMTDSSGRPVDHRKHIYAQAFALYSLAEHYRATGRARSRDTAVALQRLIEEHAADERYGGYTEAFHRDWRPRPGDRLSDVDLAAAKSENTHLHLLEAYATLVRAVPEARADNELRALVELFLEHIVELDTGHTRPFFDCDWTVRSTTVSFGHDIETAWLLTDAADALGDLRLADRVAPVSLRLAETVLEEGLDPEGGVCYQVGADGVVDREKEWWTQAEAIVGLLAAYQATGRSAFLAGARDTWAFVRSYMLDREGGEWFRRTTRGGMPLPGHEKVGPWKGPYHNVRACLQVMERTAALTAHAEEQR